MMKKLIYVTLFIILASLLLLGCREITVTTVIHADGSCERVMVVRTDSTSFFENEYPIPIDTTWELNVVPDTTGEDKFIYTARKKFASVAEVNGLYANDTSSLSQIERSVHLKKQFRWIYTFFTYKETYKKMFDGPALSTCLNEKEMYFYKLTDAEKDIFLKKNFDTTLAKQFQEKFDDKFATWLYKTTFNAYYNVLKEEAQRLNITVLAPEILEAKKDTFFKTTISKLENSDDFLGYSALIYGTDTLKHIKKEGSNPFQEVDDKMAALNRFFPAEEYKNIIEMPGLIIENNAVNTSGDTLAWIVKWDNFLTDDYEMYVKSRTTNTWAIVASDIIGITIILGLIFRWSRKRKRNMTN